jgi:hypothetical protein
VIPGNGTISLIAGGGGSCESDQLAAEGYLAYFGNSRDTPGRTAVSGMVPDGVTSVTIKNTSGVTVTVPVHDNVYLTFIRAGFKSLWFHTASRWRWIG